MSQSTEFSGSIPEAYDRYLGPLLFIPFAEDLMIRIRDKKINNILELACGTGRVTKYLSELFPDAKITATDINPHMLEFARKSITGSNIEWSLADMQEIPFEDSSFDLVLCQFGIMFVPDKVKAFKEIFRVLRPAGLFLFNTWKSLDENELTSTTNEVVNSFFKDNPVLFYQIPFSYFNKNEIENDLREGGFSKIYSSSVTNDAESSSVEDAAKGLIRGNPVLTTIKERDPDLVSVISDELSKKLKDKFGDNPMKCVLNAIVIEAVK